jgi:hypothetical protein
MSDAPSLPEGGGETRDRPRPEAQPSADAPAIALGHLPPPGAEPEEPAAAASRAGESEEGLHAPAADPPAATSGTDAAPAPAQTGDNAATLPLPPLPMMLPPFLDAPGGELSPMPGEYGPAEEDPSPLRFLREPVQYVGAPNGGPPADEVVPPAVAFPTPDESPPPA